jgi:hypothetical protein
MIPVCTFRSSTFSSAQKQRLWRNLYFLSNVLKHDLDVRLGLAKKMCGARYKIGNIVKGGH